MLESLLQTLIKEIDFYNSYYNNKIFKKSEIDEELENIEDMGLLLQKLTKYVVNLKQIRHGNSDLVIENLIKIHMALLDLNWHIDQVHGLTVKLIENYRTLEMKKHKTDMDQ